MFNGFYPTSSKGCEALTNGLSGLRNLKILDPSAGKGDILDYVNDHYGGYRYKNNRDGLYAIEIEPELRAILAEKGYKVIDSDFLRHTGLQHFDIFLMNPPFDEGAKHLLKAWDVANGAIIRCFLNSETLRNPYTQERKQLAQIIEEYGWAKELGPIFKGAERSTNVEITLVHLEDTRKKEGWRLDFDPDTTTYTGDFEMDEMPEKALALGNIFDNYEARYMGAVSAFKEMLLAKQKVVHYLNPLTDTFPTSARLVSDAMNEMNSSTSSYDSFLEASNKAAWDHLFRKTKLGSITTEGVRKELEKLQADQGAMAFTSGNMKALFDFLFLNREQVIKQCILEVFDELTKYHKDNRQHYPGWKTNTAYAVKARFILPNIGSYYREGIDYDSERKLDDIEKALCFLSGKKFDNIRTISRVYKKENWPEPGINFPFGKKIESEFFATKLFKKRSMHFLFLDEDLRVEFNTFVARERWGQLPEKVKQGAFI